MSLELRKFQYRLGNYEVRATDDGDLEIIGWQQSDQLDEDSKVKTTDSDLDVPRTIRQLLEPKYKETNYTIIQIRTPNYGSINLGNLQRMIGENKEQDYEGQWSDFRKVLERGLEFLAKGY